MDTSIPDHVPTAVNTTTQDMADTYFADHDNMGHIIKSEWQTTTPTTRWRRASRASLACASASLAYTPTRLSPSPAPSSQRANGPG